MGEFSDAVSTLLDAFARGISVIKRKKELLPTDPTQKVADRHLSKSLKKSRTDVKNAYTRDLKKFGPGFAHGDEARTSISAILFRLNAGFVSVIERFTKGRSTQTDYQALLNLSNSSRMEAIHTFSQLSQRLSCSSLALVPAHTHKHVHKRKRSKSSTTSLENLKHARSKSAPSLSVNSTGWVRPKPHRKTSSTSTSSSDSRKVPLHSPNPTNSRSPSSPLPTPQRLQRTPPPAYSKPGPEPKNRKSIMSFASDSTKLGEIPEHKWARRADGTVLAKTYYPIEPYREPVKEKSRFMRLFRR